jgi:SPP1 gp7 family putative phage head morphogenesis protein
MYLVRMVQARVLKQIDEFIDRLVRALEPELRKRFLHLDADKRSPITLARKTLKSLGQIDDTFRPETLKGLRASEEFRATGRTSKAFDRAEHETGIRVAVERDGNLVLRSGSHRFKVAKELGLDSIWGTVVDASTGRVLFVGDIPLKAAAQAAAPPLPASIVKLFETGPIPVSAEWLRATFRVIDHQASTDLNRVIGVPTREVLSNAHELERKWVRANTDLIKLPEKARREIEAIVTDPIKQGRRVEEIRKEIQERLGVTRSRAETNARSQTLRTYGQIQEERQRAAGIEEYVWSTSEDERVRPDHADLDGTTQRWDSPPVVDKRTGRREHPGFDYNCRCAAVPVLTDD